MADPAAKYKSVLVTGGARRIGAAIASDLAGRGYAVAVHYNDSHAEGEALADQINAAGGRAVAVQGDLLSADGADLLIGAAREKIGPLGVVVNNASVFEPDRAEVPDMALWRRHFAIHLEAPVLLAGAFARQTEIQDGLVVNVIDQRVWRLNPNFFSYTLSKSALWTATRTMAQSFAPNIRVNAIGPGPTMANERQTDEDFEQQVAAVPLMRGPALSEFGSTIAYLDEARSVTGQMIALDGGQHLAWETPDIAGINE